MGKLMHKTTSKSTHISVFEFPAEEPHVTFTDILIILISLTHFKYLFFLCVCEMFFFRFFFYYYLHRFNTDVLWNKFQLHLCLRVHLTHINSLLTAADRTEIKTFFFVVFYVSFSTTLFLFIIMHLAHFYISY